MNITIIAILQFSTQKLREIGWLGKLTLALHGSTDALTPDPVLLPGTTCYGWTNALHTVSYQHSKVGKAEKL